MTNNNKNRCQSGTRSEPASGFSMFHKNYIIVQYFETKIRNSCGHSRHLHTVTNESEKKKKQERKRKKRQREDEEGKKRQQSIKLNWELSVMVCVIRKLVIFQTFWYGIILWVASMCVVRPFAKPGRCVCFFFHSASSMPSYQFTRSQRKRVLFPNATQATFVFSIYFRLMQYGTVQYRWCIFAFPPPYPPYSLTMAIHSGLR